MARGVRRISESGIYHVIIRGVAQQVIFYEDSDRIMYLDVLSQYTNADFQIYGYCLMDNHIHLLVQSNKLSDYMKRVGISHVWRYNAKNERAGHLYQNRFFSEIIYNDAYLLRCLRYIHRNPIKAGLCNNMDDYKWSSSHLYFNSNDSFVSTRLIEDILVTKDAYSEYMGLTDGNFPKESSTSKIGNKHLEQLLETELNGRSISQLSVIEKQVIANSLISSYFINKKHLSKLLAIPYRYVFPYK